MDDQVFDDIEIAPPSVVLKAARDFAAVLAETPQFKSFEQVAVHFLQDQAAQRALTTYQEKQRAWRAPIMHNMLNPEQKAELESLKSAFINQTVVKDFFNAQTELATLCQTVGDALSESIGLNYASACGVSCCG